MKTKKNTVKILLSSFGFNSPIMCEKFKSILAPEDLKDKVCLVLPYAGFNPIKAFEKEKQGLVRFGFSPNNVKLVKSKSDFIENKTTQYIYVPGGDPFKLLKYVHENELEECIRDFVENGAMYIGVSAGAYIAAKNIAYVLQLEDNNEIENGEYQALGLIPQSVICHYDHYSFTTFKNCQEVSGGDVITIEDDKLAKYENGFWGYL